MNKVQKNIFKKRFGRNCSFMLHITVLGLSIANNMCIPKNSPQDYFIIYIILLNTCIIV
jgi:hypothetical protein